jgi:AcrR family transcriptional regulator
MKCVLFMTEHRASRSDGYHFIQIVTSERLLESPAPMATTPEKKVRRSRAEQRAATEKLILDTAEDLFSQRGYFGVTIKDVADAMGIHPALIHYYHDGKQSLFESVWERRVELAVSARIAGLEDYANAVGDNVTIEGALRAFYDNAFDAYIHGEEGWRSFGRIFAQVNNAPGYGTELMDEYFDPLVLRLIELLKKAVPDASDEDLFWCFQLTSGAYTLILSRTGRIDRLSNGACSSDDFQAVRERFVTFMAAGFAAVFAASKKKDAPQSS